MTTSEQQNGHDEERAEITQEELDAKPWKYIGYKDFAAFVASDEDFFVLRRFDRLHSRVLLALQADIAWLEESLDVLDARLSAKDARDVDNGSVREDQHDRKALLSRISQQLRNYDTLLCHYLQLKSRPSAPKTNVRNIKTWLDNNNGPIQEKEVEFIIKEDLITVAKNRKSPARMFFERRILVPTNGLFGLLTRKGEKEGSPSDRHTILRGNDEHVDVFGAITIFTAAAVMLIAPLWILAGVDELHQKLAAITIFLAVFLFVLSWGTSARPFEMLAATAGYSAVLVVFLQLGATSGSK